MSALGLFLGMGFAGVAVAQSTVRARPTPGAPQPAMARVSKAVPESCVLIRPIAARIEANGDQPNPANEKRATDALAVEAAKVGGQLVVPWGLGHSLDSLTRYGYAFRCSAQAAASAGNTACREGRIALPPTAQEQLWGTIPSRVDRLSDCTIRPIFRMGTKMPQLGVDEYFAHEAEDCVPSERKDSQALSACTQKLAARKRARSEAQSQAWQMLAHAIRVKEETLAVSSSEQAFGKLADAFGKNNPVVAEARSKYRTARLRCQRDGACNTFGDDPASRGGPVGAPAAVAKIEHLRDEARYAEAVLAAVEAAKAGAFQDPGQTRMLYAWHAARILLLDLGQVKPARTTLEQSIPTLERLWQDEQRGVGASFGMAPFHVDTVQVANAQRTLALARLADGDRAGALVSFEAACRTGGCAPTLASANYSLQKEQALLELGLGRCPAASARLMEMARAAGSGAIRDARWADASLELLTASLVCGKGDHAEASFRALIGEDARLNGLNVGESGASAGSTLGRRLAYVLLSWALEKPSERARVDLALDAVLSFKGNLLTLQRDAVRRAKPDDVRALNGQLEATYASMARANEDAVIALALHPGQRISWRDDPWRLRQRADALERDRARLAGVDASATVDVGAKLARSLSAGQALLEYVRFRPYDFKPDAAVRFGDDHYAAFVVRRGEAPALFDLGPASRIDQLSENLLNSIQSCAACPQRGVTVAARPSSSSANAAQALYRALLDPLAKSLGATRDLYIAADAALWRVPFAALESNAGKVLLDEGYVFRYLPTSQELLRAANSNPARSFFALGAPDYGDVVAGNAFQSFKPLPNTSTEVTTLAELWKTRGPSKVAVDVQVGAQANKRTLLGASSYGVLHVATHGWFLPSSFPRMPDTGFFLTPDSADIAPPMVRAGLALSGANRGLDGTVTALELSTLDLRSTQLVVLSACETGRGEVRSGEGVFGLSRAFLSDGAETVVSSLWNVDDASTRALMLAYYGRLLKNEDRVTSLYQAARELRATPSHSDPWFWAGFLVYGRGGPLRL